MENHTIGASSAPRWPVCGTAFAMLSVGETSCLVSGQVRRHKWTSAGSHLRDMGIPRRHRVAIRRRHNDRKRASSFRSPTATKATFIARHGHLPPSWHSSSPPPSTRRRRARAAAPNQRTRSPPMSMEGTSAARCRARSGSSKRERDEFRFAPPLNQSPFVPAEAGTQEPRTRPKNWVPASAGTNGIKRRFKLSSSRSSWLVDATMFGVSADQHSTFISFRAYRMRALVS